MNPSQHLSKLVDRLSVDSHKVVENSPDVRQLTEDFGIPPVNAFLGIARQCVRTGQLYDAAVACLCALAHAQHIQEQQNDARPDDPRAAHGSDTPDAPAEGEPPAAYVGTGFVPDVG